MRYSQLFGKTTKTVTSDADSVNAKLLTQAGFIQKEISGDVIPDGAIWDKIFNELEENGLIASDIHIINLSFHAVETITEKYPNGLAMIVC
jgi:hypothetical protein